MKIESHQTEPEIRKMSTKNVAWYWRVPYIYFGENEGVMSIDPPPHVGKRVK